MVGERLDAEVARIVDEAGAGFGKVAAQHSAGSWLLRRQSGRLSAEHLGCATPEQQLKLATGVGVTLAGHPV